MRYAYSGFDASGKPCRGVVETESEQEARDQLRKQGTFVAEIDAVATSTGAARAGSTKVGASRRLRAISTFARQLELLLSGGTPLVQALLAAERQSRHAGWKRVLADVRTKVEEGLPLSVAMRSHPEYFDSVCTSLAAAGETSGAMA